MAQPGADALLEMWKKQLDEGTQAWLRMVGQGSPTDPQAFWRPFMDQGMAAWAKVMTQGAPSPELLSQWKQFLDQWIAAWSRVLEQAMATDSFAQALGRQLETFLNAAGPARRAADQQVEAGLASLGVPSRSQVTGLARQLVQVEEKIEALEDKLDEVLKRLGDRR